MRVPANAASVGLKPNDQVNAAVAAFKRRLTSAVRDGRSKEVKRQKEFKNRNPLLLLFSSR